MAFDYKKEYKEFYLPGKKPQLVEIPRMNYIAVRGKGDPNEEGLRVQCIHMGAFDEEYRCQACPAGKMEDGDPASHKKNLIKKHI